MYDNVCKFLAEVFSEDFSDWLIGKPVLMTELKPTELSLQPIRADSVIFLQSKDFILHIEFQTAPDDDMAFRMADYRLRLYRRFPEKEVYQVVIYLKPSNSELVRQNTFQLKNMIHEFNVIRLWEEPTEQFLRLPGLLPLAVLSQTQNPVTTLTQVAETIDKIEDRRFQSNVSASTAILAGLLLNQNDINKILRSDIMRESVIYQEIFAEGELKGELKGEKRGEEIGKQIASQQIALSLLQMGMSVEQVAQATQLSLEQLQALPIQGNVSN